LWRGRKRTKRASAPWARTRTKRASAPARKRTMVVYDAQYMATHNGCRRHVVYIQERIVRMYSWYMRDIYHNQRVLCCATFIDFQPRCHRFECTNLHGFFVHCLRSQTLHISPIIYSSWDLRNRRADVDSTRAFLAAARQFVAGRAFAARASHMAAQHRRR
jgi:hypothetical protein